jgi:3-deoxy-manno-octulosonate cytidylyltransferase (CMP-KDO synthetase)
MTVTIIIPARYASTRYLAKPLVPIKGASGVEKSLIRRTWEAACKVDSTFDVYVATDSPQIADHVEAFGGAVLMTAAECRNGTERCWDAARQLNVADHDIIVNFQGDSLLTPPHYAKVIVDLLRVKPQYNVATAAIPCSVEHYYKLENDSLQGIVGGTFTVSNSSDGALYFSKRMIPFRANYDPNEGLSYLHIGIYAYRVSALRDYTNFIPSSLELLEGLEQLRFLDNGQAIGTAFCESPEWELWELNNPSDLPHIEIGLSKAGLE